MRSLPEDRTSRAIIRDEALRLFADHGPDAVTVRDVATAADVSPALVMRHYRSKDGLRAAVDEHVTRILESMLAELTAAPADGGPFDRAALPTLVEAVTRHLPDGSPVPGYLGRMLIAGGPAGTALFRNLHAVAEHMLAELAKAGLADAGDDPPVRAAVLLVNDLAVLILRHRLTEVLGTDPLSMTGMRRWGGEVLSIYRDGLTATRPDRP